MCSWNCRNIIRFRSGWLCNINGNPYTIEIQNLFCEIFCLVFDIFLNICFLYSRKSVDYMKKQYCCPTGSWTIVVPLVLFLIKWMIWFADCNLLYVNMLYKSLNYKTVKQITLILNCLVGRGCDSCSFYMKPCIYILIIFGSVAFSLFNAV